MKRPSAAAKTGHIWIDGKRAAYTLFNPGKKNEHRVFYKPEFRGLNY